MAVNLPFDLRRLLRSNNCGKKKWRILHRWKPYSYGFQRNWEISFHSSSELISPWLPQLFKGHPHLIISVHRPGWRRPRRRRPWWWRPRRRRPWWRRPWGATVRPLPDCDRGTTCWRLQPGQSHIKFTKCSFFNLSDLYYCPSYSIIALLSEGLMCLFQTIYVHIYMCEYPFIGFIGWRNWKSLACAFINHYIG